LKNLTEHTNEFLLGECLRNKFWGEDRVGLHGNARREIAFFTESLLEWKWFIELHKIKQRSFIGFLSKGVYLSIASQKYVSIWRVYYVQLNVYQDCHYDLIVSKPLLNTKQFLAIKIIIKVWFNAQEKKSVRASPRNSNCINFNQWRLFKVFYQALHKIRYVYALTTLYYKTESIDYGIKKWILNVKFLGYVQLLLRFI